MFKKPNLVHVNSAKLTWLSKLLPLFIDIFFTFVRVETFLCYLAQLLKVLISRDTVIRYHKTELIEKD